MRPVHFKSHWLWALLLLDERVGIILDPLVSHTGHKGHKEIFGKIWLWREAVVVNDIAPRPIVTSLEEGRRRRAADILEMGGSGSVLETQKKDWVTIIWKVPQQRDGSACGIYLLATVIALTRGWSLQDSTNPEQSWVRKARAWFLKVTLANTAGARMCLVCSYSAEVIDMEEEDQCPLVVGYRGGSRVSATFK
jgi:hypothetical protein